MVVELISFKKRMEFYCIPLYSLQKVQRLGEAAREESIQEDHEKREARKLWKLLSGKWVVRDSLGSWLVIFIKGKEEALHCSPVDVGRTL